MKKLFLLTITAGLALSSFAQSSKFVNPRSVPMAPMAHSNHTARTTANTTDTLENITSIDTEANFYLYPGSDSGFVAGMNYAGFTAFAERYDISTADSPTKVIGVLPIFGYAANPSSTNQITLKVWSQGAPALASSSAAYNGLPSTLLDSLNVPVTSLGITPTTLGTNAYYFARPTAYLTDSFFIGYSMNYTWGSTNGDTIALATGVQGSRVSNPFTTPIPGDTLINDQNAFMVNGTWYDYAYNLGFNSDLLIFPIVIERDSLFHTGVGITNRNFTFFGTYPNPAVTSTNARFSLQSASDVTIQVMDINGRTINTVVEKNLSAGEHTVNIPTADLSAGDYLLFLRSAEGGGIANKFTVIK